MYQQIKLERKKIKPCCPLCQGRLEWCAGKVNESEQQFMCRPCRIYITLNGFTAEDQQEIAEEAFM